MKKKLPKDCLTCSPKQGNRKAITCKACKKKLFIYGEKTYHRCPYCNEIFEHISSKDKDVIARKRRYAPRGYTDEEGKAARRKSSADVARRQSRLAKEIAQDFDTSLINWERRVETEKSLKRFCEVYLASIFYLGWSKDQLKCLSKVETVCSDGGMFCLAMPRGGGKTALCRGAILWATINAYKRFPYFIGSSETQALKTLNAVKMIILQNKLLREDYPEICFPVRKIEGRNHLSGSQIFNDEQTHINWSSESVRFASCLFTDEQAKPYREAGIKYFGDPEHYVYYIEEYGKFLARSAGTNIATSGIDGSIRGEAEVHPITLEQPRPDLVLLDDVQKDQKAESPASCDKLIRLIDGAVTNLSGPDQHIAALMPCTVIRDGDASDTYLSPDLKEDWQGERCRMVTSWPKGINDFQITLDTEASRLWNKYIEERKNSLRLYGDIRLATELYKSNREIMDKGFSVSWEERYTKKGINKEISAQQHAMERRIKSPQTFVSEFQNIGKKLNEQGEIMITSAQLQEKVSGLPKGIAPFDSQYLVSFIDVQDEMLFYMTFACSQDFTGSFIDYGTFPEVSTDHFTKNQTAGWNLLSREFLKAHPDQVQFSTLLKGNRRKANLDAKIYWAVQACIRYLLQKNYVRQDGSSLRMEINKIGVDTRWGQVSNSIRKSVQDLKDRKVIPYFGQPFPPSNKQLEEYIRTKGWIFEDQKHPQVKSVKWVLKPDLVTGRPYMLGDPDRLKDFLFARLAAGKDTTGSVDLFQEMPYKHEMVARQICDSEHPQPESKRGITKNRWIVNQSGRVDNEYLDCGAGCMALASLAGAVLDPSGDKNPKKRIGKTTPTKKKRTKKKISDRWKR